jgi:hypothetical protein
LFFWPAAGLFPISLRIEGNYVYCIFIFVVVVIGGGGGSSSGGCSINNVSSKSGSSSV